MSNQKLSLAQSYKDYFDIGVAINPRAVALGGELIKTQFNSVTCENEMKPVSIQPQQGEFTFTNADMVADFAVANDLKIRGHTLVWHSQTGRWMYKDNNDENLSKELLYAYMKEHIDAVLSKYAGKVYCWDVVNEAISDESDQYLRVRSPYFEIVGSEEFIEKAFFFAHEADPGALLFYNDYNTEIPEKREKVYRLVKSFKDKNVPIHGVGLQGHYNVFFDLDELKKSIEMFSSLGLAIHITELDISLYRHNESERELRFETPAEAGERMDLQTELYEKMFTLLRQYKNEVGSITFWGLNDRISWLNNFPVRNRRNFPLLFDDDGNPKEAYHKIIDFVD